MAIRGVTGQVQGHTVLAPRHFWACTWRNQSPCVHVLPGGPGMGPSSSTRSSPSYCGCPSPSAWTRTAAPLILTPPYVLHCSVLHSSSSFFLSFWALVPVLFWELEEQRNMPSEAPAFVNTQRSRYPKANLLGFAKVTDLRRARRRSGFAHFPALQGQSCCLSNHSFVYSFWAN